jgi:hypothetical protein
MIEDRRGLTFAQAEGVEELPRQLALREISPELSAVLWAVIHEMLDEARSNTGYYGESDFIKEPWNSLLRMWWILRLHKNIDELPEPGALINLVKKTVTSREYVKVFDFLQFIMSRPEKPHKFDKTVDTFLKNTKSAYRVVENHIIPTISDEQADAVRAALAIARSAAARGPHAHLRSAASALSSGDWAEAIRESIHAVEASAKSIEPSATTLGPALDRLKTTIGLHPALLRAYNALYGYTSDEKGIRHALVFGDAAEVGEREAIFMFGACAAFVGYLLSAESEVPSK